MRGAGRIATGWSWGAGDDLGFVAFEHLLKPLFLLDTELFLLLFEKATIVLIKASTHISEMLRRFAPDADALVHRRVLEDVFDLAFATRSWDDNARRLCTRRASRGSPRGD